MLVSDRVYSTGRPEPKAASATPNPRSAPGTSGSVSPLIGTQLTFIESMMSSQYSRNLILRQLGLYFNDISVFPHVLVKFQAALIRIKVQLHQR